MINNAGSNTGFAREAGEFLPPFCACAARGASVDANEGSLRPFPSSTRSGAPPVRGRAVRCRPIQQPSGGFFGRQWLTLNDVHSGEYEAGCIAYRWTQKPKASVIRRANPVESPMEGQGGTTRLTLQYAPRHGHATISIPSQHAGCGGTCPLPSCGGWHSPAR